MLMTSMKKPPAKQIAERVWLIDEFGRTSMEEWLPSAKWLLEMSRTHDVYWAHRVPKLTTEYIAQVIRWGEEIIAGQKRNTKVPLYKIHPLQMDGIIYTTNTVHKNT